MPSQTFSASSPTAGSLQEIWKKLQDASTWEAISGVDEVESPTYRDDELVGFTFYSSVGGRRYKGTAIRSVAEPPGRVRWDIANSEIKGWVEVGLLDGQETSVDVSMQVESVSMMASFGFPLIAGAIGSGFQNAANEFAKSLSG